MVAWFNNLKTITKLMAGFGLVGAIMAFVGYTGVSGMGTINESVENINNVQLKPLMTLTKVRGLVHQMRAHTVAAALTQNAADREAALTKIREISKEVDETREVFAKTIKSEEVKKVYENFVKTYDDYRTYRDQVIFKALADGKSDDAMAAMKSEGAVKFKASIDAINQVVDTKTKIAQEKYDMAVKTYGDGRLTLTAIIVAGIGLGLFLGWVIARVISKNLQDIGAIAGKLANGDLTARSQVVSKDEVGQLCEAFNEMVDNLTKTVVAVREAAEGVTSGAEQISQGNQDLSQRTSEQASALEETSASMEEMTSTVKQNADNAKQANQLGVAARDVAEKGGAVTTKAVAAMAEINKSSKKIGDIITVIDEIAFQTNLLALNAAVEAARAGEHGRGFAVVAAEVRNLAQRSATAAKEIKGLIQESMQKVTEGSELVDQSGKTLEEIVSSVKRVTDIVAEISAASQEQASGIDQVNKAIVSMDETTQQNAALVEEAASASQAMKDQAIELVRQVGFFKTSQTEGGHSAAMKPASVSGVTTKPAHKPLGKPSVAAKSKPVAVGAGAHAGNGHSNGHSHTLAKDEFEEF
ncbi:MAG: HAMP domain-containing protein [Nitrospira sp.]|nr:HAMP domain-containing protein [Nitrospira sp.]